MTPPEETAALERVLAEATSEFRPVVGWEGKYEVSKSGLIRNFKGNFLTPQKGTNGYLIIRLSSPRVMCSIHRIVALAWVPNPLGKPCVNHIDNNIRNPGADNLEWCTQAENLSHMDKQGRRKKVFGRRPSTAKLTNEQVSSIREEYQAGCISQEMLGRKFAISKRSINRIVNGVYYV